MTPADAGLGPYDVPPAPPAKTAWDFARDDEGWHNTMGFASVAVRDGVWTGRTTTKDPAVFGPGMQARADQFAAVTIRMKLRREDGQAFQDSAPPVGAPVTRPPAQTSPKTAFRQPPASGEGVCRPAGTQKSVPAWQPPCDTGTTNWIGTLPLVPEIGVISCQATEYQTVQCYGSLCVLLWIGTGGGASLPVPHPNSQCAIAIEESIRQHAAAACTSQTRQQATRKAVLVN